MSIYLDASFLVPLFVIQEPLSSRAATFMAAEMPELVISDFAKAEFASAIARLVRMDLMASEDALTTFADFDTWTSTAATQTDMVPGDVAAAGSFIRRLDRNLRTPDALNIAIARRVQAAVATFDSRMAENAAALGVRVATV